MDSTTRDPTTTLRAAADRWFADTLTGAVLSRGADGSPLVVVERAVRLRGAMPPLTVRDVDETYRVLAGELTFYVGEDVVHARAGDVVVVPRLVERTYRVESPSARWVVLTRAAAPDRYEDFGRAHARPQPAPPDSAWTSEEELAVLTAIAAANGIRVLAPPGAVPARGGASTPQRAG